MKRLNLNTDTTLNSNSNTLASSQKAIKTYADTKLSKADKAVANGVASLDASGKVPSEQIPALPYLPTAGGTLSGQLFTNSYISFNTSGGGVIFPGGGQIVGFDTGNVFLQNANNGLIFRQSDKQLVRRKDNVDSIILTEAEKAIANGVASLDANAKVPSEQIPVATASTLGGVKVEFDETTGTLNIKTE